MRLLCFVIAFVTLTGCNQTPTQNAPTPSVQPPTLTAPIVGWPFTPDPANIIANPSFESGLDAWKWLDWSRGWAPFKLSFDHALDGLQSLHLPIRSTDRRQTVVWGGVQELTLQGPIPECIEGYYFVDNWASGPWKQYLQLVIIDLSHNLSQGMGQAQLRYIISGSKTPPLSIANAHYLFAENVRRDTPVIGQWTYFSVNPRHDFSQSWQYIPTQGAHLRILFEGRFDLHQSQQPARADVYYDRLYMGPKTPQHCSP